MALLCLLLATAVATAVEPKFQTLEQYTRLQLPVAGGSTFSLLNGGTDNAILTLDRVRPGALEAIKSWRDDRVKSVEIIPQGLDKVQIQVNFHKTGTDSFAYMQGGMLVMDLWQQSPATAKASEQPKAIAKAPKPKATSRGLASVKAPPKPVETVEPLHRDKDLFQRFVIPMPELILPAAAGTFALPPTGQLEDLWQFTQEDKQTDEGKSFGFAKKLFREKKYGLAIKTVDIVLRDQPKTPHKAELEFLQALAYKNLGESTKTPQLESKAAAILEELGSRKDEKGNSLPFHRAIQLYFAQRAYVAANWLQAILHLEYVAQASAANDPSLPYVQIMLAECYGKVNQPRRAERIYRYLFERHPQHVVAKEARYRIADLLALERNYLRVVEEGEAAVLAYPEYEKNRSEVLFQMGEASFWLGHYARAEKYFRRFTDISSAQTNAALAWVRLGEINELAKHNTRLARQDYLRAKNGYPFSQGDLVASVRLARIDLPIEKEPQFIVKTFSEMLADKTMDGDLRRMAELTLADYLLLTNEEEKAIELARTGMGQTEGTAYEGYKRAYMRALFAKLVGYNRQKRFSDSLALYDRERKWFDQYGAESFKAMADAYRGLGLYATSNELMEKYTQALKAGRGLASAKTADILSLAKAKNSFARGAYSETLQYLPADNNDAEIQYMAAVSNFKTNRRHQAYSAADKALALSERSRLPDSSLEEIGEILMDRSMNDRDFPRMEKDIASLVKQMEKESERLTYAAADALWYQKKHDQAVKAYLAAIEKFPKGERAARAQYNVGMSYVSLGKREQAVKQLTQLMNTKQGVWSDSAKQELELLAWEAKYSSVLRTLPPSGLGVVN